MLILLAGCFFSPTNDRDNRNPERLAEMTAIVREQGQLAPFPSDAEKSKIWTEGNMFTRYFYGGFCASPTEIDRWVAASPGLATGLPPGGTADYQSEGKWQVSVERSQTGDCVDFAVEWS